jgi:cobalt-precorrin 5A hydrolase
MTAAATALITLSAEGARLLTPLIAALPGARLYIHESVRDESAPGSGTAPPAERFTRIAELTAGLFPVCRGLIYAAPAGVVVRAIAPFIRSKYDDPAIVVLDAGGRWAVSLLAGHEGGANALAIRVANILGAEPVVTTTTEALKSVIVGIGCRRGTPAERIVVAVNSALAEADVALEEVRLIASVDLKADEPGLLAAAEALGVPVRFVAAAEIRASARDFSHSDFVEERVKLPAVAEPAALLAGRRTRFIQRRKTYNGITIALAREGFPWTEPVPEVL